MDKNQDLSFRVFSVFHHHSNAYENLYVASNILYKDGMSAWCADCHGNFHGSGNTGSPEPWFRHPQDETINGAIYADYTYWSGSISNRVPVEAYNVSVTLPSDIPSDYDEVFCLSCHEAHGSANKYGLVYADGSKMLSTCQQCHNQ